MVERKSSHWRGNLVKNLIALLACALFVGCGPSETASKDRNVSSKGVAIGIHKEAQTKIAEARINEIVLRVDYPIGKFAKAGVWEIPEVRWPMVVDAILNDSESASEMEEGDRIDAKAYGNLRIALASGDEISIDLCSPLYFWHGERLVSHAFTSESLENVLGSQTVGKRKEDAAQ